jgi:alpha-D-ribose 1-methylphosphonate 5-triphosphate synthase subunit PhnH
MTPPSASLVGGFSDPVLGAQACFRVILDAMARPGRIQTMPRGCPVPPAPLHPAAFTLALTLFDFETPVWLDPLLRTDAVTDALRFHCGCPMTDDPARAAFALVGAPRAAPPLAAFHQGTPEYPDRSTTVVLQVEDLSERRGARLSGPGVQSERWLAIEGSAPGFWRQWQDNRRQFPQGVDVVLVNGDRLAALPRGVEAGI